MKAKVYVTIKANVLDPQGNAVQGSLHSLGFDEVCASASTWRSSWRTAIARKPKSG